MSADGGCEGDLLRSWRAGSSHQQELVQPHCVIGILLHGEIEVVFGVGAGRIEELPKRCGGAGVQVREGEVALRPESGASEVVGAVFSGGWPVPRAAWNFGR